jgi:hypothetical protein
MNSPSKDPARSNPELDYAPPRVRERMRRALGENTALPVEKQAQGEVLREPDNRAWHQRALDPELVPEPPPGVANFWPRMLRMGIACAIAAFVAAAVVLLFDPKQNTHKIAQADATPPAASSTRAFQSADSARVVPALTDERSAASTPLAQEPPQTPPTQSSPPGQVADAEAGPPPQAIAPIPAQNPSLRNLAATPSPAMNKPPSQLAESGSLSSNAPQQAASLAAPQPPSSAVAKQPFPKQPAAMDDNEISALIKRGNNLLKEGDFAAARLLFERAANAGSAEAALALGSTYDPLAIKRLGAIAVKPDIESARKWYQIAADRGSAAATLQLANLQSSR